MEFRKMLMITLYAEQKKRHRFIEQSFRLCGRRQGRDVSRQQHRNMYTIKGETDYRPRLAAWDKCSGLVLWEDLEGADGEGGGRGDRDGEDMWTQGLFISMYDKIHYKKKKKKLLPDLFLRLFYMFTGIMKLSDRKHLPRLLDMEYFFSA